MSGNYQRNTAFYDLVEHLERQQDFSLRTFGPGLRTEGLIDHIKKELTEIAANPRDVVEWVDVILLALDGAWRAGYMPEEICAALVDKLERNMARNWPDWRTADPNKAIEHVREQEANKNCSTCRFHDGRIKPAYPCCDCDSGKIKSTYNKWESKEFDGSKFEGRPGAL